MSRTLTPLLLVLEAHTDVPRTLTACSQPCQLDVLVQCRREMLETAPTALWSAWDVFQIPNEYVNGHVKASLDVERRAAKGSAPRNVSQVTGSGAAADRDSLEWLPWGVQRVLHDVLYIHLWKSPTPVVGGCSCIVTLARFIELPVYVQALKHVHSCWSTHTQQIAVLVLSVCLNRLATRP